MPAKVIQRRWEGVGEMIKRIDRKRIESLPKAARSDGMCLCPLCWHPLCEPISGKGRAAIWCRMCKRHIVIELDE